MNRVLLAASAVLLLLAPAGVSARAGGLGVTPILGWNTWCTQNSCGTDWCTSAEVLDVAQTIKDNGMQALGYNYINLDDCWGVRDNKTNQIMGDPTRFPEGMAAFIAKLHAMGFKAGLYTDWGQKACHYPFVGSFPFFQQDAETFASWKLDYLKLDGCDLPAGYTGEQLTGNMSAALNSTGRDIWLNFHCWNTTTCATYGNSYRIAPDHHDDWDSTSSLMSYLVTRMPFWGANPQQGWPDLDFVFTGGEGCGDHSDPGVRCPGQTDDEYISEFTVWAIASGQILIATDPRNMSAIQKKLWYNQEVLAMFNDTSGFQNIRFIAESATVTKPEVCSVDLVTQLSSAACNLGTDYGCYNTNSSMWTNNGCRGIFNCDGVANLTCSVDGPGVHVCNCTAPPPQPGQIWARPLLNNAAAVALHNPNNVTRNITVNFADIPARSWSGQWLKVRDLWAQRDIGMFYGAYTAMNVPPHGAQLIKLTVQ